MRIFGTAMIVTVLMALLAASLWFALGWWTELEDADLPLSIYLAMAGGIVFSLLVGIGLMALVFYSSRQGYDDRAAGSDLRD
jgi:phosphate/sulfate permease